MTSKAKRGPATRIAVCSTCLSRFESVRRANGKWPRTCSVGCQIDALRRFAQALLDKADRLESEVR